MNEIAEEILSIIGIVSIFMGAEFFFYRILDKYNKHEVSYLLHGFTLFLIALNALYPGE